MRLGKLYVYARMRYDQDTTTFYQAQLTEPEVLRSSCRAAGLYSAGNTKHCRNKLKEFLQKMKHCVFMGMPWQKLTGSGRTCPAEQEALLEASEVLGASQQTFSMLNNADLEFPVITDEQGEAVEVTHGKFIRFMESADRRYDGMLFRLFIKPTASFAILLPKHFKRQH